MKNDNDFCILSVKYSILEGSEEGKEPMTTTEMEHVFVAREKSAVLKKIKRFEERLRNKKKAAKAPFFKRIANSIQKYLERYRYNYETLLRL